MSEAGGRPVGPVTTVTACALSQLQLYPRKALISFWTVDEQRCECDILPSVTPTYDRALLSLKVPRLSPLVPRKSSIKMNVMTQYWWESTHRRKRNCCKKHTSDSPKHTVDGLGSNPGHRGLWILIYTTGVKFSYYLAVNTYGPHYKDQPDYHVRSKGQPSCTDWHWIRRSKCREESECRMQCVVRM